MRKIFLFSVLAITLSACNNLIKNVDGSENIVKLNAEPVGCTFLYKMDIEATVYSSDDANRYMQNSIANQIHPGNAYFITNQRTRPTEWIMFGPENTFILTADVYECPNPENIK